MRQKLRELALEIIARQRAFSHHPQIGARCVPSRIERIEIVLDETRKSEVNPAERDGIAVTHCIRTAVIDDLARDVVQQEKFVHVDFAIVVSRYEELSEELDELGETSRLPRHLRPPTQIERYLKPLLGAEQMAIDKVADREDS